jgi:uncharacterized protein DUF4388
MTAPSENPEVKEALYELQQYLSDRLAPLMVADSLGMLATLPPELTAAEIQTWIAAQYHGAGAQVPISDYLFHALRKIHVVGDFSLVPAAALQAYLQQLKVLLLEFCPEADRELLRTNLARLGESTSGPPPPVEILHRQPGGEAGGLTAAPLAAEAGAPPVPMSAEIARGMRRFTLLLDRLARTPLPTSAAPDPNAPDARRELLSQAVAQAAQSASSGQEMDQYLDKLRQTGVAAHTDQLFRALGDSLPGWSVPLPAGGAAAMTGPAEAMYRIVALSPGYEEAARRFRDLVQAAVHQFNEGLLTRAATMFGVASRLVAEKKVGQPVADAVQKSSNDVLGPERLRKFAESPDRHALLRSVMNFYARLTPQGLLRELREEERRDRRRLLLALLEVHGAAARAAAMESLETSLSGGAKEADPYYQRNLIYLLRQIPRPPEAPVEDEIDLMVRAAPVGAGAVVLKEAILALGRIHHDKSEVALVGYLRTFEVMALKPETAAYDSTEVLTLLDRTASSLAALGTKGTLLALLDHGLKAQPELGDARLRLMDLGGHDLRSHPVLAAKLVATVKAELPKSVMGIVIKKGADAVRPLVAALAGTPSAEVQALLSDVAARFSTEPLGQAAARALAAQRSAAGARAATGPSLSGDLELFGLPNLLQNLADNKATGALTLFTTDRTILSVLNLEGGRLRGCQTGVLRGKEAFYQLCERPLPGTFALASHRDAKPEKSAEPPIDLVPLILEGLRRHDELRQASALVADDARLQATGAARTSVQGEANPDLVETVWKMASAGTPPRQCESEVPVDAYRVRRLLAHWVEEGALAVSG